jgi:general secretion pathway protein G
MIELIFVIVIIGILAAVAIPKLAATRADADAAKIANNLATCINDAGSAYLKTGSFGTVITTDSVACTKGIKNSSGNACYTFTSDDANGSMTVTESQTDKACKAAHDLSRQNNLSGTSAVTHNF